MGKGRDRRPEPRVGRPCRRCRRLPFPRGRAPAGTATYLPIADADLAAGAPVVVRVRAGESSARRVPAGPGPGIVTLTDLDVLEVLKGRVPSPSIRIVLPGETLEGAALWVSGRPTFVPGQEAILFVRPARTPG